MEKRTIVAAVLLLTVMTAASCHRSRKLSSQSSSRVESGQVAREESLPPYEDSEAYDVYVAVINQQIPENGSGEELVIVRSTTDEKLCLDPTKETDDGIRTAGLNYAEENQHQRWLVHKFSFERPYTFMTSQERSSTFREGVGRGWQTFRQKHPKAKGFIELSAVGFSSDKKTAVVYEGYRCGGLCGSGSIRVLQKSNGKWQEAESGFFCGWWS